MSFGMDQHDLSRAAWRKSFRSGSSGGECVEAAVVDRRHLVRDSKDPDGGVLVLAGAAWRTFIEEIKSGAHDL